MKRKVTFLVLLVAFVGMAMQSCASRRPKCPGVYSQVEQPVQKVKHV